VVAKAASSGDTEEVQRAVGEAIFVASIVGLLGMFLLTGMQDRALSVVGIVPGSATAVEAAPYIGWRALTFVPAIISTVGRACYTEYARHVGGEWVHNYANDVADIKACTSCAQGPDECGSTRHGMPSEL